MSGCLRLGRVEKGSDSLVGPGFPLRVTHLFWNEIMEVVAQHYKCIKRH